MITDDNAEESDLDSSMVSSPETVMGLARRVSYMDNCDFEASFRQERAIFDIQGDTSGNVLILTPFQQYMEILPRPEARSMSSSWVVQPVSEAQESEVGDKKVYREETLKTAGMVRGMWKLMVQPIDRYNIV